MSIALTSSAIPTSTRQEPLRVMVVDDFVVIRGIDLPLDLPSRTWLSRHRCAPALTPSTRSSASIPMLPSRYRNAGTRRHFRAAAAAGKEAQPHHHHGIDAYPPQRGDQLQGALARRIGLHSKAGKHPRAAAPNLSSRSHSEDPSARRQGSPRRRHLRLRPWRPLSIAPASPLRGRRGPVAIRRYCAVRSVRKSRACS